MYPAVYIFRLCIQNIADLISILIDFIFKMERNEDTSVTYCYNVRRFTYQVPALSIQRNA